MTWGHIMLTRTLNVGKLLVNSILKNEWLSSLFFFLYTASKLMEEQEHTMDQDATEQQKEKGEMPTARLMEKINWDSKTRGAGKYEG